MTPITEKLLAPEEYEKTFQLFEGKLKQVEEARANEIKKIKEKMREVKKLKAKSLRAQNEKIRLEAGSRIEKVLGRPLVREDLDRLENFLHEQEARGNHFTKVMSGKPQETELSTLSALKNGLRSL